jgi:Iap family predicted aminopeptidase
MAASSTSMMTINLMRVSEKLVHDNHILWKVQVLAMLRGAQLARFLDGTNQAPAEKIKLKKQKDTTDDIE